MQKISLIDIDIFKFDKLSGFKSITHFVTGRRNSVNNSLSLSLSSEKNVDIIISNRNMLAKALNIPIGNFIYQHQEHTKNITIVTSSNKLKNNNVKQNNLLNNDGMLTHEKNICLMVMGADCVPLLYFDPVRKVIGAAHAGWRGTVQGIAIEMVSYMVSYFNCQAEEIIVGIGPSIGPENYEVDLPVYNMFREKFSYTSKIFKKGNCKGKFMLDLWKANQMQLLTSGIKAENIEVSNLCTFKNNDLFFSARRGDYGRFGAGIMMNEQYL
jgi:YfiH family protein